MDPRADQGRSGHTRSASESFPLHAAFIRANANLIWTEHLNEIGVGSFGCEMFMIANFGSEILDHRFVRIWHEQDRVRNPRIERMDLRWPIRKSDLLL